MTSLKAGDLLTTNAPIICHQVNCCGVMGAGIAKQIATQYPVVLMEYRAYLKRTPNPMGTTLYVKTTKYIVANLFAQRYTARYRGQVMTDYQALQSAMQDVKRYCLEHNLARVAFPYGIGCGLAGGSWDIVRGIIGETFNGSKINVEIWRYGQ